MQISIDWVTASLPSTLHLPSGKEERIAWSHSSSSLKHLEIAACAWLEAVGVSIPLVRYRKALPFCVATMECVTTGMLFSVMVHGKSVRHLVTCSSAVLAKLNTTLLFEQVRLAHGYFTRIDIAIDVFEHGGYAKRVFDQALSGHRADTELAAHVVGNTVAGITAYVGKRNQALFWRVYEKGKQLKSNEEWVRFEAQLQRDFFERYGQPTSVPSALSLLRYAIQGHFPDMPFIMRDEIYRVVETGEQEFYERADDDADGDWLLDVVVPHLVKLAASDPERLLLVASLLGQGIPPERSALKSALANAISASEDAHDAEGVDVEDSLV